jgi:hypothetical protein
VGQVVGDDVGGGGAADAGDEQCGVVGGSLPIGYQGRDDVVAQSVEIASVVRRVHVDVRGAAHFFGQGPAQLDEAFLRVPGGGLDETVRAEHQQTLMPPL